MQLEGESINGMEGIGRAREDEEEDIRQIMFHDWEKGSHAHTAVNSSHESQEGPHVLCCAESFVLRSRESQE